MVLLILEVRNDVRERERGEGGEKLLGVETAEWRKIKVVTPFFLLGRRRKLGLLCPWGFNKIKNHVCFYHAQFLARLAVRKYSPVVSLGAEAGGWRRRGGGG
jgi:hypothetical protein